MKTKAIQSVVILSALLLPVASAFAQRAGQHLSFLTTFTNALAHDAHGHHQRAFS